MLLLTAVGPLGAAAEARLGRGGMVGVAMFIQMRSTKTIWSRSGCLMELVSLVGSSLPHYDAASGGCYRGNSGVARYTRYSRLNIPSSKSMLAQPLTARP